jgi:hypothetical protein
MVGQSVAPVRRNQPTLSQSVDIGVKAERDDIGGLLAIYDFSRLSRGATCS